MTDPTTDDTRAEPSKTEAHIAAMAATLGLTIAPEWTQGVQRFFETARDMADLVARTGVLETSEPAPVFTPREVHAETTNAEPR